MCFHMCKLFGVKHINTGLMEDYPVDYTAQKLRELCDRAGDLIIALEPMPYSGLPNLDKTWKVLQKADRDNAMMLLDTWHWVRANQPSDLSTKEQAKRGISIKIDDDYERSYADSKERDELMLDRLAPGAWQADTVAFLKMIMDHRINPNVVGV